MKLMLVASLMLCALHIAPAHAVSGSSGQAMGARQSAGVITDSTKVSTHARSLRGAYRGHKLVLDPPVTVKETAVGSMSTVKSLVNGDSLVNPWMPGRGAIGVKVKVTW